MIPRVDTLLVFRIHTRDGILFVNDAIIRHLHDVFCLMISIAPLAFGPWDIPIDVSGRSRFPFLICRQ